jgi:uncharacterized cupin superfamily protein
MAKIEENKAPQKSGSRYPSPLDEPCKHRRWTVLGDAAGLTQFGVNKVTLPPGTWSSQRHWHSHEDEFVYVLAGEVVLVEDGGETLLSSGDSAGFPAGTKNGHCLQNRSDKDAVLLVVGSRDNRDHGEYSDVDMRFNAGRYPDLPKPNGPALPIFTKKDGTPFTP